MLIKENCQNGTELVRPRERSAENWGTDGTLDAEVECRSGCLKPYGIVGDGFLGFRFPASPQFSIGLSSYLSALTN